MSINLNRDSVLCEVQRLLSKSPFTKEDSSKAERLMQLADTLSSGAMELRRQRVAELSAETAIHNPSHAKKFGDPLYPYERNGETWELKPETSTVSRFD